MRDEAALEKVKKEMNTPTDHRYKSVINRMHSKGSKPKEKCLQYKRLNYRGKKVTFFRCMKVAKTERMVGRIPIALCEEDAELWDDLVKWAMIDFYMERFPDAGGIQT